jgi:hypothetical protein
LPDLVPDGANLFAEGPSGYLQCYLESHPQPPLAKIERSIIWPSTPACHVQIDHATMGALAEQASQCCRPTLATHIQVFAEGSIVLCWHDFPFDPMYVTDKILDEKVHAFCARLGVRPQRECSATSDEIVLGFDVRAAPSLAAAALGLPVARRRPPARRRHQTLVMLASAR